MTAPAELTRELERLGLRYGEAVVREEAKRLLRAKRGNKPKSDLVRLRAALHADALDILEGRNPTEIRKNHSIARDFAEKFPDKTVEFESVVKRIERKLRRNRLKLAARGAFLIAEEKYPFSVCLDIHEKYKKISAIPEEYIKFIFEDLSRYRALIGEPPKEMTIGEIRAGLHRWMPTPPSNFLQVLAGQASS